MQSQAKINCQAMGFISSILIESVRTIGLQKHLGLLRPKVKVQTLAGCLLSSVFLGHKLTQPAFLNIEDLTTTTIQLKSIISLQSDNHSVPSSEETEAGRHFNTLYLFLPEYSVKAKDREHIPGVFQNEPESLKEFFHLLLHCFCCCWLVF